MNKKESTDYKIHVGCPASEVSHKFLQGMADRMAVSFHKYGLVKDGYGPSAVTKTDAMKSLDQRIKKYHDTGNTEWLMDVANFAMIEFMEPSHPKAHFRATSAKESPGRTLVDGEVTDRSNHHEPQEVNCYRRQGD